MMFTIPTKKMWFLLTALSLAIAAVVAFQVLVVVNVTPPGNCFETDSGINFLSPGSITGTFNVTGSNQTFNGTFFDACLGNNSIIEFVCGSSIHPNFRAYAAVLMEDCTVARNSSNSTCMNFPGTGAACI